jgi:methionyl-tRNA synthetase
MEEKEQKNNSSITIDDFTKVEMRVGKIILIDDLEWSNKLLKMKVDFGEFGIKTVLSGIKKWYREEDLLNKCLVFVTNLAERKIKDEVSQAMILMVEGKEKPSGWFLSEEEVELGSLVG